MRAEPPFAPAGARAVELVFRDQASRAETAVPITADPRFWLPGETVLLATSVPLSLPAGAYDVLLALRDPAPMLHDDPRYSIQLANEGTWDEATGENALGLTLTVE